MDPKKGSESSSSETLAVSLGKAGALLLAGAAPVGIAMGCLTHFGPPHLGWRPATLEGTAVAVMLAVIGAVFFRARVVRARQHGNDPEQK